MDTSPLTGLIDQIMPLFYLLIAVSMAMAILKLFLPMIKGRLGEAAVNSLARRRLDQSIYHLIPDVTLPTPGGTTQIDHVIVSRYGIFVLETKNYAGWIYGSEKDAKWTQVIYRNKERFQNPLHQNYKHTKTLADLTGIPHEYFKSLVVFVGDSTFKSAMPDNVVQGSRFVQHIKSFQTPIIKDSQVPEIASVIQEWAGTVSDKQRRQHVRNLHRNREPVSAEGKAPPCPHCGEVMILRTSRKANTQFWGRPGVSP